MSLAGKTLFITGASRGIGLAIALRAARDGALKTGMEHGAAVSDDGLTELLPSLRSQRIDKGAS